MIKSLHIVPSIYTEASGPSYSVPKLCEALARQGEAVELHVLAPIKKSTTKLYAVHGHRAWPVVKRLGISPPMHKVLKQAAKEAQIMHNHSLWMLPNIYPLLAIRNSDCRLVTSPRGTLSEYALGRSRWLKKILWGLGQGNTLKKSSCLHATSEMEYREIRRKGLKAPVAIIPNGIEMPSEQKQDKIVKELKRLLFLGRIHPIKGIDVLIRAWAKIEKQFTDWELCILGPDNDNYSARMNSLAKDLTIKRINFAGAVYGSAKSQAYWSADLFVLPSYSENFGMTVAEALAHGKPAIVSKGAPWQGLETHGCGWWIEVGEAPLTECLREALTLSPEEMAKRGALGRAWVERDFSWPRVGEMMHKTYLWLLGDGLSPDWVRVDG